MARYTGPKRKLERRENATLFATERWKKRPTPPGQHGAARSQRPNSYAFQFREKQKVKRIYGLLEKQFNQTFKRAQKITGNTGLRLLQLLELRLDNVIFRLGLAKTRMQARQIVNHGHVLVNGKKLDIPSYICNVGDEIEISQKFLKKSELPKLIRAELKDVKTPEWLDEQAYGGKVVSEPTRNDMDRSIRETLIIEFYSR